ncbi:MAG: adenine phosphoribosyltransferase [Aerococcus sp.]|nr:adenine phosphoribosyltransferase [Aerococcus sp.]
MNLKDKIVSIPNYPKEGIIFRDVMPLFEDPEALKEAIDRIAEYGKQVKADVIVGPEARGFMVGVPVAYAMNAAFVPARKPGKLPRDVERISYDLEYGSNELEILKDAIKPGQRVLLVDDLLATGGTVKASRELVEKLGGEVVGAAFIIELVDLKGCEQFSDLDAMSLIEFEGE